MDEQPSVYSPLLSNTVQLQEKQNSCQIVAKQLSGNSQVCFLAQGDVEKRDRGEFKLWLGTILAVIFMISEIVVGYYANSVAVLADAAHMFSDVSAFLFSLLAMWFARQKSNQKFSFGYHRAEIFGALMSILIVWLVTGALVYEAILRIVHPPEHIDGKLMSIISGVGIAFNIVLMFVLNMHHHHGGHSHACGGHSHSHSHGHDHSQHLHTCSHEHNHSTHAHKAHDDDHNHAHEANAHDDHNHAHDDDQHNHHHDHDDHAHNEHGEHVHAPTPAPSPKPKQSHNNLNVQAAIIHAFGDLIQSIGVFISGLLIYFFSEQNKHWYLADPLTTFIFAILVITTTITVLKEVVHVLMEAAPIDLQPIQDRICKVQGVHAVHDMHMWSLSSGVTILTAHVDIVEGHEQGLVLKELEKIVSQEGVNHSTIQICAVDMKPNGFDAIL